MAESGFFLDPDAVADVAARHGEIADGVGDCAAELADHRFGGWTDDDGYARPQATLGAAAAALVADLRARADGLRYLGEVLSRRVDVIAAADREAFGVAPDGPGGLS